MTREEAVNLVDYHYWARDRVLEALDALTPEQYTKDLKNSFTSIRDTVVHTYGAERTWHLRWIGDSPTAFPDASAFPDVPSIRAAWREQEQKIRSLVDSLASSNELDRRIRYRSFAGEDMESAFSHMLQHVVNHATYHRGQVTTMLRQLGASPPKPQDLIRFYRERATKVH